MSRINAIKIPYDQHDFESTTLDGNIKIFFWLTDDPNLLYYKYDNGNWAEKGCSAIMIKKDKLYYTHSSLSKSMWSTFEMIEDYDDQDDIPTDQITGEAVLEAYKTFLDNLDRVIIGE